MSTSLNAPDYTRPNRKSVVSSLRRRYSAPVQGSQADAIRGPRGPINSSRRKIHTFEISRSGKKLAGLTVLSSRAVSRMPVVIADDGIQGFVNLFLDQPEAIQAIEIGVQGKLINDSSHDPIVFLDIVHSVWSGAVEELSRARVTRSSTEEMTSKRVPPGEYSWDFIIDLPQEIVTTPGRGERIQRCHLPPTFTERYAGTTCIYELSFIVTLGSFFSYFIPNQRGVVKQIGIVPRTVPPPLPESICRAYRLGRPIPPPWEDPSIWSALRPARMTGKLSDEIFVDVECLLHLAKPLVYTRGSVIPMFMELVGPGSQALCASGPHTPITCVLRRTVRNLEDISAEAITYSQPAIWWTFERFDLDKQDPNLDWGCLRGELRLSSSLKPTSSLLHFQIDYDVVLLPFEARNSDILEYPEILAQPVDIVTAYAPGITPKATSPPGYNQEPNLSATSECVGHVGIISMLQEPGRHNMIIGF